MKIPKRLLPLVHDGLIDAVLRPLMSGKEASVLLVESGGVVCCAKVYKEASKRSFKQRADYQEGRGVRNSRRARAMAKRSKYGKAELEDAWQNTEVDTIYALHRAGVRVPKPYLFSDGVLLMELIAGSDGLPAPRLNDVRLSPTRAREYHAFMIQQVVRMLCGGLIHGDLSEYNVLLGPEGPVIIDFPQAVNAAANQNAKRMLLRDVNNMRAYFGRFARELKATEYGKEIWKLYERGELHPEVELSGLVEAETRSANVEGVLADIEDARDAHHRRFGRKVVDIAQPARPKKRASTTRGNKAASRSKPGSGSSTKPGSRRSKKSGNGSGTKPQHTAQSASAQRGPHATHAHADPNTGIAAEERPRSKRRRRRGGRHGHKAARSTPEATSATPEEKKPPTRRRRRRRRKPTAAAQQPSATL